jgi:hypothetical protein
MRIIHFVMRGKLVALTINHNFYYYVDVLTLFHVPRCLGHFMREEKRRMADDINNVLCV